MAISMWIIRQFESLQIDFRMEQLTIFWPEYWKHFWMYRIVLRAEKNEEKTEEGIDGIETIFYASYFS